MSFPEHRAEYTVQRIEQRAGEEGPWRWVMMSGRLAERNTWNSNGEVM